LRKIVAIGIIVAFMFLMGSSTSAGYIIEDNKVYTEGIWGKLEAYPHTIHSSDWVYFNITMYKDFSDLDFLWGFNTTEVKPVKAEFYKPHFVNWTTSHSMFFYNVSSISVTDEPCDYGNEYNSYKRKITYQVCSGYNNTTECNTTSAVVCFDSYERNGANYTVFWHTKHSRIENWINVGKYFNHIEYNYGGMNRWYFIKNFEIEPNKTYTVRAYVKVPVTTEGTRGKYFFAVKRSAETLSEAISNGHFMVLDPWWNSSWNKKRPIHIDNTGGSAQTYYQVSLNISYDSDMQPDFDDIRVVNETSGETVPYWIENKSDGNWCKIWFNASYIPASSWCNDTYYLYYNNSAASSASDVSSTFIRVIDGAQPVKGSWHFDENSGTTAYDTSGNDNDGTIHGATWTTGKFGSALSLDGVDDYVDVGTSLHTDYLTFELWMMNKATSHKDRMLCSDWDGADMDWQLFGDESDGTLWLRVDTVGGKDTLDGTTVLEFNTWYHIVATYDGTTMKLYVNGQLDNSKDHAYGGVIKTTGNPRYIGKRPSDTETQWLGLIDEVRIYNRALSAEEISDLYNNYGYTTTNYLGRVLVRKYADPEPTASLGSEEENYPPIPIITGNTTYNFGVNYTFTQGSGYGYLDTDSFNISWKNNTASGWQNGTTDLYFNHTTQPHGYVAIDVWAYNSTEGKLSESPASDNMTVPNNAPVITNTSDWEGDEGELVYLDFDCTDADGDTCTFSTNATKGSFNTTTGVFEWQTDDTSQGTYTWWFKVEDGWGGEDIYVATITVNDLYQPTNMSILNESINLLLKEQKMTGLSFLLGILIIAALVFLLLGVLVPNSVLTLMGAVTSFIAMALPIPMMPDYPYFGIALTGTLFLFGIIGFIITFYQWLTSYREGRGYRKWERYFE